MPDVDVSLGAHTLLDPTLAYVTRHPDLRGVPLAVPTRTVVGSRLRERAIAEYTRAGARPMSALGPRIANRVAGDINQVLDQLARRAGVNAPRRPYVYHSPFGPLPRAGERRRGVRYFVTIYDLIPFVRPEVGGREWLRPILDSIGPDDHVLAISEHTKRDLLHACPRLAPERVTVTPLAADPALFHPVADPARLAAVRARYALPDGPYLLSLSTLAPHKNLPRLLRAFAELVHAERVDDLQLVLTGVKGWGYDAILRELDRLGAVSDRVHFTDYVDDADLAALYSGALAFVYPSYYEGFGLPPLEAMQCGTPVITGNTSSLPEVVGAAGLTVDPHDTAALAQALWAVYRDAGLRAELSQRALVRAGTFTWARYAERTVAAYRAA